MSDSSRKPVKYDLDAMTRRKTIVVQATTQQLSTIKTTLGITDSTQVKTLGNDIYGLGIEPVLVDAPELVDNLDDLAVSDLDDSAPKQTEKVESFANSAKFYNDAKLTNGYKIISDEFSNILNAKLYKGFSILERTLRQLVIENFQLKGRTPVMPRHGRKKSPDHIMSQFELGEFFEILLKAPASEPYMKAQWRKSTTKDENEVIRIANLTVLDEIDPGLNFAELDLIRGQRNKCMHFNVVTLTEYKKIVPIMNKYLKRTASRGLARSLKGISVGLQGYLEQVVKAMDFSPLTKAAAEMTKGYTQQSQGLSEAIRKMLHSDQ